MAAKYQMLAGLLKDEFIKDAANGRRLPTEAELTRHYRMSRQTIRHALQLLAEEGLVERRQGSGTYTTGKAMDTNSQQVAVIATFLDDYIFPAILYDAQSAFAREGYSTAIYTTGNQVGKEREILTGLLQKPVKGLLVEGSKTALPSPNLDLYRRLSREGTQIVFLHGACAELSDIPCISDDNYGGGYLLARRFIESGHQDIAGIFKSDDIQGLQRYQGVVAALRDSGLPIQDRGFDWYDTHDREDMLEQNDAGFLRRFIERRLLRATAVVCYNDEIAYRLIRELLAIGRKVPEEVAVVSFDNSYYSQMGPVPITSLAHKGNKMGRVAAEQLIRIFQGSAGASRTLEWTLVERRSG